MEISLQCYIHPSSKEGLHGYVFSQWSQRSDSHLYTLQTVAILRLTCINSTLASLHFNSLLILSQNSSCFQIRSSKLLQFMPQRNYANREKYFLDSNNCLLHHSLQFRKFCTYYVRVVRVYVIWDENQYTKIT